MKSESEKKQNKTKKSSPSHVMRKKGDSGCVMMIFFFSVCDE